MEKKAGQRAVEEGFEALDCASFQSFCRDVPIHETLDVAGLPAVYNVYRSLCENGLWKVRAL
jgi:hypothetical protein